MYATSNLRSFLSKDKSYAKDFPLLALKQNTSDTGVPPYAYLDNAATTQKPAVVLEAIEAFYEHYNANPYRGVYQASRETTKLYETARLIVAEFIGASADSVVFTRNTTEALNIVAFSYALEQLHAGDHVVIPISEHHSNLVIWQQVCTRTGAELVYMHPDSQGRLTEQELEKTITNKTKIVALAHVSNVLGSVYPVKKITKLAHSVGAVVVLDCAQSVAHTPLDLKDLDVDFAAFSGHKMYAPMGIGVLYGKSELLQSMLPFLYGGEMIDEVFQSHSTYEAGPKRFEAGTPNVEGALGLATAIDYLQSIGLETIRSLEHELKQLLLEGLRSLDTIDIYGNSHPNDDRSLVVAFNVEGAAPNDVAYILDTSNIAIRSGTHCAQPLHRWLGIKDSCRVSPCFYNTPHEISRFLEVLSDARRQITRNIMTFFP